MKLHSKSYVYDIRKVFSESEISTVCMAYRKNPEYPWIRQKVLLKIFQTSSPIYPLELDSLLQMRSPYCVSVLNFETIEGQPALILEWIDSLNLFQLLRQTPPLNPFEVSRICFYIQKGLIDLNKQGLCHGDLSLSNVLIDRKGHIRLIDFGKGNYMNSDILSTPCFTAPEIFKGEKPNFHSDLFALGILEKILSSSVSYENQQNFLMKGDPFLDPCPQNRRTKEFINHHKAKETLSQKVNSILNQQASKKMKSHLTLKKRKSFSYISLYIGLIILGLTGSGMYQSPRYGSINIRSHQWMHVEIDHKSGFTPFESGPLLPGTYHLIWKNEKTQGIQTVIIKENSHLLLTEKDFQLNY